MPEDTVGFDELRQRVEDGDTSAVLLNVLSRGAFEAGRIPSSVNLPVSEIGERAGEVLPAPEQETIAYCASSTCTLAQQAVHLLRNLGYTNVREYHGGMEEWAERGGRIERAEVEVHVVTGPRVPRWRVLLSRCSPASVFAWASAQPLPILFGIWFGVAVVFAAIYWGAGEAMMLASGDKPIQRDSQSMLTALAFSIATAMAASYGEVVATGLMRVAVLVETVAGLFLFSALVTKILGAQQEQVLSEIHRVTFENRVGRVRTNLQLVLTDLADLSNRCSDPATTPRRLRGRIESVAMIFASELKAARDLLRGRPADADDVSMEALFACFASGLEELGDLLTCLVSAHQRSGSLRRSLRTIAHLGEELCNAPSTRESPALALTVDRVQRLCRALSDELRPGDTAPRFALPATDGKVHRLADHFARDAVVLVWFPKAFTGG